MRVGVLARADDRGIGYQTWEFFRHIPDCSALVIREAGTERQFPARLDRFPDQPTVWWDTEGGHRLPEDEVRDWLSTVDVVYSPETLYDRRLGDWAREAGVATVIHVNAELWRNEHRPTRLWLPTPWCAEDLPRAEVVPVPVAPPREPRPAGLPVADDGRPRLLHVIGRRAAHDRNGTVNLYRAVRYSREPIEVTLAAQEPKLPSPARVRHVRWARHGPLEDRWDLYAGHGILVLPRRYGGLCLPAQEAAASGLALVMPDCPPNVRYYPALPTPLLGRPSSQLVLPGGAFRPADTDPRALGPLLDRIVTDPGLLAEAQEASIHWTVDNLWSARLPEYLARLADAADAATDAAHSA